MELLGLPLNDYALSYPDYHSYDTAHDEPDDQPLIQIGIWLRDFDAHKADTYPAAHNKTDGKADRVTCDPKEPELPARVRNWLHCFDSHL